MKNYFIIAVVLCFVFVSCEEEKGKDEDNSGNNTNDEYFIEGKVDGELVRAECVCDMIGCNMLTGYYNSSSEMLTLKRTMSATNSIGWNIVIMDINLDEWILPDSIYAYSSWDEPSLMFSYYTGPWESDNHFSADAVVLGDDSFQLIVTSKTGDVIEGNFSGELRNGSDTENTVTVTEGKFKIGIERSPEF